MQLFHLQEERYLICLKKRYSWNFFRKRARVSPGTYSEDIAKGLYSSVFKCAIDLGQEYRKYYCDEYENIYQFMFWRYGISEEIRAQIPNAANEYSVVFTAAWQMEDDDLLKNTFVAIFNELEK